MAWKSAAANKDAVLPAGYFCQSPKLINNIPNWNYMIQTTRSKGGEYIGIDDVYKLNGKSVEKSFLDKDVK